MINQDRIQRMEEKLIAQFSPEHLVIEDQSYLHVGHEGAKSGRGHFKITISAKDLQGLSRLEQHRKIYECLGAMMDTDIHALTIDVIN